MDGYERNSWRAGSELYIRDINFDISRKFSKNFKAKYAYFHFDFNTLATPVTTDFKGIVNANVHVLETQVRIKKGHSLRTELQALFTGIDEKTGEKQDKGTGPPSWRSTPSAPIGSSPSWTNTTSATPTPTSAFTMCTEPSAGSKGPTASPSDTASAARASSASGASAALCRPQRFRDHLHEQLLMNAFTLRPLGLLASVLLLFGGCDVLDDPVIPLTINYRGEAEPPSFDALSDGPQHVLLEDFTAHQCGNCPPAGVLAEQIAEDHDGLVHVLAIHAGSLAAVSDAPFDTDWTNDESNAYWDQLAFQVNPIGRVNRRGGPAKSPPPTIGRPLWTPNSPWPQMPTFRASSCQTPTSPATSTTPTSRSPAPSQATSGLPCS